MSFRLSRLLIAGAASACFACAEANGPAQPELAGHAMVSTDSPDAVYDPFQPFNRAMFWVNNDVLDAYIYGPLAHGWMFITPLTVRIHLEQFVDNLNSPGYVVYPLLQLDPKQSGIALARFGINTTVGIAGIFDPADHYLHLRARREDMGQTLGVWGMTPGPYLVLPVLAPRSCARDLVGMPFDWLLNVGDGYFWPLFAPYGETMLRDINRRALVDADLKAARDAAVDWYSSARDLYFQARERDIRNGAEPVEKPDNDLYESDDSESLPE
ncbi:MAG TPA: VacJ family lipoprotein [Myxococcota bacterium]|nr:VacJ family lipoprotein [Myxococcota bacterium]